MYMFTWHLIPAKEDCATVSRGYLACEILYTVPVGVRWIGVVVKDDTSAVPVAVYRCEVIGVGLCVVPECLHVCRHCMYMCISDHPRHVHGYPVVPTCSLVHQWLSRMLVPDDWVGEINS